MADPSSQRPRLLTAGYLTLDLIVRDACTLDYWDSPGGTCGNVSVFASGLGTDVSILARVGEDQRGRSLVAGLVSAGVDTSRLERDVRVSTPGIVELIGHRGAHRFTFECPICETRLPKAATVSKRQAEVAIDGIDRFEAFFLDRATLATVRLAEAAREAGLLVVFEPTSIPRTFWAKRVAALSDIVKVSRLRYGLMDTWHPGRGASTKFIIETLGAQGARFRGRRRRGWGSWQGLPAPSQSHIRDTAGAGDWLTAGLITSLLPKSDALAIDTIRASIEYGQRLSAVSLAFDGPGGALAALGMPTIEEIARSESRIEVPSVQVHVGRSQENSQQSPAEFCGLCLSESHGAGRPP